MAGVVIVADPGTPNPRETGRTATDDNGNYTLSFGHGPPFLVSGEFLLRAVNIRPAKAGYVQESPSHHGCLHVTDVPVPADLAANGNLTRVVSPGRSYRLDFTMVPVGTKHQEPVHESVGPERAEELEFLAEHCTVLAGRKCRKGRLGEALRYYENAISNLRRSGGAAPRLTQEIEELEAVVEEVRFNLLKQTLRALKEGAENRGHNGDAPPSEQQIKIRQLESRVHELEEQLRRQQLQLVDRRIRACDAELSHCQYRERRDIEEYRFREEKLRSEVTRLESIAERLASLPDEDRNRREIRRCIEETEEHIRSSETELEHLESLHRHTKEANTRRTTLARHQKLLAVGEKRGLLGLNKEHPLSETDKLDICEAIFRYQFKAPYISKFAAICLQVEGNDPPPAFLDRFRDHTPPVIKGSRCVEGIVEGKGKGVKLHIDRIYQLDKDSVIVSGEAGTVMAGSSHDTYKLSRKDGKWRVDETVQHDVS